MGYIDGTNRGQLSCLSLDDMVAEKSLARVIDRFIELQDLDALGFTRTRPAGTGRPGYAPGPLAKLYVYGYENGIRSSRKLEKEAGRNVELMWLMEGLAPDHKTISDFRRLNVQPLQNLFREFVRLCRSWDLVGGELVAVDGSKFRASNSKKNNFSRKKLDARLARIDEKIAEYMDALEAGDARDDGRPEAPEGLAELLGRRELYETYMAILDGNGENELSTTDPDARLMGNNRGGVDVAYNVQAAVDGRHDIVLDYGISTSPSDHHQLAGMVGKAQGAAGRKDMTVLADKGYYNGEDLLRVRELGAVAMVAKQRPSDPRGMPGFLKSGNFVYDHETDTVTCPAGHTLRTRNGRDAKRRNFSNKAACAGCPHADKCISGKKAAHRTVTRGRHSEIYDETDRRLAENRELYRRRQEIAEHPFGTVKHALGGRHLLLRTKEKIPAEIALLFLGYNLKRAVKVLGFREIMARLDGLSPNALSFLPPAGENRPGFMRRGTQCCYWGGCFA